jgi:hypothetical protein
MDVVSRPALLSAITPSFILVLLQFAIVPQIVRCEVTLLLSSFAISYKEDVLSPGSRCSVFLPCTQLPDELGNFPSLMEDNSLDALMM